MNKKIDWKKELEVRESVVERFNHLLETECLQGVKFKDDPHLMEILEKYEKLFKKLINNGILTHSDFELRATKEKEQILYSMDFLSKTGSEMVLPLINSDNITRKSKIYLCGTLYQWTYEVICEYLRYSAIKINQHHEKKRKATTSEKRINESTKSCLDVFFRHDPDFKNVLGDLDPDIRSSFAHMKFRTLDDDKYVYCKYGKKKYKLEELAKK
ncbi:MAG: hypothetical protein KKA90_04065 [Nanoarchaeota archaeon]|nr:hypothetical protein [Nanoarchaeota archaeon]